MTEETLAAITELIIARGVHDATDLSEPVNPAALLEECREDFALLPQGMNAIRVQSAPGCTDDEEAQNGIVYNEALRPLSRSAWLRAAKGHEWGHIHLGHTGDLHIMWQSRYDADPVCAYGLSRLDRGHKEREADYVAAFVLVRAEALEHLRSFPDWHIARILDVPEKLVTMRREMLRKFKR